MLEPNDKIDGGSARDGDSADLRRLFPGDSEMAQRMRAFDWSQTPLGPPASWPENLRIALGICLTSRFPLNVWWGPSLTLFYNDAYISCLGPLKHPGVLGRSGREAWSELWPDIGPMVEDVLATGRASWSEDIAMLFDRAVPHEEVYATFSFSPLFGADGRVEGLFFASTETTEKIIANRRSDMLRQLAFESAESRSTDEACHKAIDVLRAHAPDIRFCAIYLADDSGTTAEICASFGLTEHQWRADQWLPLAPHTPDSRSPFRAVPRAARASELTDPAQLGWERLASEPPGPAVVVPIHAVPADRATGWLVAGLNPHRPFDGNYRTFVELIGVHIGQAFGEAQAYEEQRRRAESLAQIDRAKTAFFSNVSNEFRTPLTLVLGVLEDELRNHPESRERIDIAHRNSLRLLKLVNTLLDFSRIEAGRIQAVYEATDLPRYTEELAVVFRGVIEMSGMTLTIDCPPLDQPVFVDREMWEKIVFNLLSNAFKFTLHGEIVVSLHAAGDSVELKVSDTGAGIPPDELPRVFERFHRVQGVESRTHEGTGIGLALVHEFVKLHGGEIRVQSAPGRGTTFTIYIPLGTAHLPKDRIGAQRTLESTSIGASPFVEEATRWLPEEDAEPAPEKPAAPAAANGHVLIADDNADMRAYLQRLLKQDYRVTTVSDGAAALAIIRQRAPDLVLADVVMPRLDGIALLQALRSDPRTKTLPVILISARAGEEARLAGIRHGADDYLVKPFGARELLARVSTNVRLAKLRGAVEQEIRDSREKLEQRVKERTDELRRALESLRASEEEFRAFFHLAAVGAVQVHPETYRFLHVNHRFTEMLGYSQVELALLSFPDVTAPADHTEGIAALRRLFSGELAEIAIEKRLVRKNGQPIWTSIHATLIRNPRGQPWRIAAIVKDINARKQIEETLKASEARLATIFEHASVGLAQLALDGRFDEVNPEFCRIVGRSRAELSKLKVADITHSRDSQLGLRALTNVIRTGEPASFEQRYVRPDRAAVWVHNNLTPIHEASGALRAILMVSDDLTERRRADAALRESQERFQLAQSAGRVGVWDWDVTTGRTFWSEEMWRLYGFEEAVTEPGLEFWETRVYPADRTAIETAMGHLFSSTDAEFHHEFRIMHPNGMERWIEVAARVARDPQGRPVRLSGVNLDITDRKRRELHAAFFADINDEFNRLTSAEEIIRVIGDKARVHLDLARFAFAEVDVAIDRVIRLYDSREPELEAASGVHLISEYADAAIRQELVAGRTVAVDDVSADARTKGFAPAFQQLGVAAFAITPYLSHGQWKFMLFAQHRSPYRWRPDELDVMRELAARVYLRLERARAEVARHRTEARYRALAELVPDLLWQNDAGGVTRWYNRRWLDYTGQRADAEVQTGWLAAVHSQDRDHVLESFTRSLASGEPMRQEMRLRRGIDGEYRWFLVQMVPVRNEEGAIAQWFGAATDIHEQRLALEALRTTEQRVRLAVDAAGMGFWDWDLTTNAVQWSSQHNRMLGLPVDVHHGTYERFMKQVHPDDRATIAHGLHVALEDNGEFNAEFRAVWADGTTRWIAGRGRVFHDDDGKPTRMIGAVLDITDRRHAEDELREKQRKLEEALGAAEAASSAKDQFLATLSHELRTPLNPVLMVASEAAADPDLSTDVRSTFQLVCKHVELEARLIDDLLDLTRITRGKMALDKRILDINTVLRDAVETVRSDLEEKNIALEMNLGARHTQVEGDPVRLQQVFWNILRNAAKFTPEGGRVTVSTENIAEGETVVTRISDTGIGLTPEEVTRVFGAFTQGEHAVEGAGSHRFGGLGLGLAISQRLVEMHGGRIFAESAGRELGATFSVELHTRELRHPATLLPSPQPASSQASGEALDILLVEDHDSTRAAVAHLLRRRGHHVAVAASGHHALELVQAKHFDLVISDLGLPDIDGCSLMMQLRALQPTLAGIALSGWGMEEDLRRSRAAGFSDHLVKPIAVSKLDQAISDARAQR